MVFTVLEAEWNPEPARCYGEEKNLLPNQESNPNISVANPQPSRYNDWAIPTPNKLNNA
jgi:hypothetical protein